MRLSCTALAVLAVASCRDSSAPDVKAWQLSDTLLRIGTEGVAKAEFHGVAGAVRLTSGEIVVADRGSNQVRYFDPTGTLLRTFGREGAGPGEFRSIGSLIRFGDTLAVYDRRNSRLTLFLGDALLQTLPIRAANSQEHFSIDDRLADGRWLAGTSVSPRFAARPYRDSIAIGIFPASGEGDVQLVGWFPGPWIVSIEGQLTGLAAFFRWVNSSVAGREILVVDADQERVRRFALDGSEMSAIPITDYAEQLTPQLISQAKGSETGSGLDPVLAQKWLEVRYDPVVLPTRQPFTGFLVDSDTNLWLGAYRAEDAPGKYFVLSRAGRLLAIVTVPAGFRPTEIGSDYCLGVATDPDGLESIIMYQLRRR
jgi:hypothetical protein